jgi:SAM-dependent methyltransferase
MTASCDSFSKTCGMTLSSAWEANAKDWIAWARTQEHDGFWEGTWPGLLKILPEKVDGPVVEVGCGEGRAGRKLLDLGHEVIGVERSPTLARAARQSQTTLPVVEADSACMPLADSMTGCLVACMSLQDVDNLAGTTREIARILRPHGYLCMAIVHPFASAEDPATMHTESPRISMPYLEARQYEDHIERDGLAMTFASLHRPLSVYINALANERLLMRELHEFGNKPIPWLLTARFEKVDP